MKLSFLIKIVLCISKDFAVIGIKHCEVIEFQIVLLPATNNPDFYNLC